MFLLGSNHLPNITGGDFWVDGTAQPNHASWGAVVLIQQQELRDQDLLIMIIFSSILMQQYVMACMVLMMGVYSHLV